MNKVLDKDLNNRIGPTPIIERPKRIQRNSKVRNLHEKRKQDKVMVSCLDIRDLANTLYLKEIPGLGGIETDRDSLIDNYYAPGILTD